MANSINFDNGIERFNIHLDASGNLLFNANDVNGTGNTRMVIDDERTSIGIGTPNPEATLQVHGQLGLEAVSGIEQWNLEVDANGNLTFNANAVTGGQTRMVINDDTGNVGIGTLNPTQKLEVIGNVKATNVTVPSDLRYKEDIATLSNALPRVLAMRGVQYQWKHAAFPEKHFGQDAQLGFIAQEVEALYPQVVFTDAEGYKSLDYSRLLPVLVEAIKEQQQLITQQAATLAKSLAKIAPLNLSHFVARKIWWKRGVSPRRCRAHRLQRREPLRCLLVPMDTTFDLLQTAIN